MTPEDTLNVQMATPILMGKNKLDKELDCS